MPSREVMNAVAEATGDRFREIDVVDLPLIPVLHPEQSLSWLLGYRRLGVRYERRANVLQGLLHLARGLNCLGFLAPPTV
jgi:hypothetical protein